MPENIYKLLNRQTKATKLANYLEPRVCGESHIPVSCVQDMKPNWWRAVAMGAKVNPPSEECIKEVIRMLYERQAARSEAKQSLSQ